MKPRRLIAGSLVLLLGAGIAAPFINADRFGGRVRAALERSLHRKVEIGKVHFNLFRGPGFTISDVLIAEDPAFGVEPFAYVSEVQARIGLASLWTGSLAFSRLRLVEPSVNLVKQESGWNLLALVRDLAPDSGISPPAIQVSGGRINLKFGDTKSTFYFANADFQVTSYGAGVLELRLSGEPARTDRSARSFGRMSATGRWISSAPQPRLELEVALDRGGIEGLERLFGNLDLGLHGRISSRARVTGPIGNLAIAGTLQLEDFHRWDLMALPDSRWSVRYRGSLDWRAQKLALEAGPGLNPGLPFTLRLNVLDFLARPHVAAYADIRELPAAALVEIARHLGAAVPDGLKLEGAFAGALGYSPATGMQGQLGLHSAALKLPDSPPLEVRGATILVESDRFVLRPATIIDPEGDAAEIAGAYVPGEKQVDATVRARGLPVRALRAGSGYLLGATPPPFLGTLDRGAWSGWLRHQTVLGEEGSWTGEVTLREARVRVRGLAAPVRVRLASVALSDTEVSLTRIQGSAGDLDFSGNYRFDSESAAPDRFGLQLAAADLSELEALFRPALEREGGFLARTLRFRRAAPDWLRTRRVQGNFRIATLTAAGSEFKDVRGGLVWDGTTIQVPMLEGRFADSPLAAALSADLRTMQPRYTVKGRLKDYPWRGGAVDLDFRLATQGTGAALLSGLRCDGSFNAQSLELIRDTPLRMASGAFRLTVSPAGPRLALTSLQALAGPEIFKGSGSTTADGRLLVDLSSERRAMRLSGAVYPLKLDLAEAGP